MRKPVASAGAAPAEGNTLSVASVVAYAFPTVGVSVVSYLLGLYFFKYATDVLLIAPALGTELSMALVLSRYLAYGDPVRPMCLA